MMRLGFFMIVAMIGVAMLPLTARAAQDGTPAAGAGAESCSEVTPRDAAFFQAVAATPGAATPQSNAQGTTATPTPFVMPEGAPADDATVAEIEHLYQQLIDCLNAGDYLRAYALYSDDYLLRNLNEEAIASLAATPVPMDASQQSEFGGILDARMLDDGRIAALVSTRNAQAGELLIFSTLRRVDERLVIDDEQVVEAEIPATPEGAPSA
jgi:hypothetical protein